MLTDRELATVLAALRHWQRTTTHDKRRDSTFAQYVVATDCAKLQPLSDAEVDVLCQRLNASPPRPRYVLYDFDADELAASHIYGSQAEAQEDAEQFDNVIVVTVALPASSKDGTNASDYRAEPIPILSILARLTGVFGWREVTGPDSRCGLDYWYASPDGRTAYVNIDQGHISISIDGEGIYGGSLSDLNREGNGE